MSRAILDATLRAFVAKGSGVAVNQVIEGQRSAEAPEGLYAIVYLVSEHRIGRNSGWQWIGSNKSFTVDDVMVESLYSVEFYREGALDAAFRFSDWAMTETGLNWASTAITDGRIKGANVYAGGSGYSKGGSCVFVPNDVEGLPTPERPSSYATGFVAVNDTGEMERINMRSFGRGYYDMPLAKLSGTSGTGAVVSPRGFGFDVKHPLMVRNLTGVIADDYEERAQIDLRICHTRNYIDEESGRVEEIKSDSSSVSYNRRGSPLMYIYQSNLIPPTPTSRTDVREANRGGIVIPRIAEWTLDSQNTGANGIGMITLLDTDAIVPQYGRDLIATSPFIANYEGHIVVEYQNVASPTSFNALFFLRTTHKIPGSPVDIVSTRATKKQHIGTNTTFSVGVALSEFNSMVILESGVPNGGTIGMKLELGCAWAGNINDSDMDDLLRELNTGANNTSTPTTNANFSVAGFSTRATFLQHDLA